MIVNYQGYSAHISQFKGELVYELRSPTDEILGQCFTGIDIRHPRAAKKLEAAFKDSVATLISYRVALKKLEEAGGSEASPLQKEAA